METSRSAGAPERRPTRSTEQYREALATAVARSPLSRFPEAARAELLSRGVRLDLPCRAIMYRPGDPPLSGIVVRGGLRVFLSSADGREFTLFWVRPGEWVGYTLIAGGPMDLSAQAVRDVSIHMIPVAVVEALAHKDPVVAWEVARQTSGRVRQATDLLHMLAFMDLRHRIGHRLLELAFRQPGDAPLVAFVTRRSSPTLWARRARRRHGSWPTCAMKGWSARSQGASR